jgi:hypothetical protein
MKKTTALGSTCVVIVALSSAGCHSPAGMAMQLFGKAVDTVETQALGDELVGQNMAAADVRLGKASDAWREVGGSREWRVYPVAMDVLGSQRYVVQVVDKMITAVAKVKIDATGVEVARKLMYQDKVIGKSPEDCETALGMGPPLVTARSESTGMISQLYDARIVKEVSGRQYCRLRFNSNERCSEVALVDVSASSKDDPTE